MPEVEEGQLDAFRKWKEKHAMPGLTLARRKNLRELLVIKFTFYIIRSTKNVWDLQVRNGLELHLDVDALIALLMR